MEFTEEQWRGLEDHADERGLLFLSSPFSSRRCDCSSALGDAGVEGRVGRGVQPAAARARSLATGVPVLLSTGMSPLAEIDAAVAHVREATGCRRGAAVHDDVSRARPRRSASTCSRVYRARYGCPVGLSDHSGTIYPGARRGRARAATSLEMHVTLSPRDVRPRRAGVGDDRASCAQLVEGVRFIEAMRAHPVDKDADRARELAPLRALFTKSVVAARATLPAGTVLQRRAPGRQEAGHRDSRRRGSHELRRPARCVAAVAADALLSPKPIWRSREEAQSLRRRHRAPELQPDQDRAQGDPAHPDLELQLVVAASALLDRYGNAVQRDRARTASTIAARVYMVLEGENPTAMAKTTGLGLLELATVFDNLQPDVVVTVADRYETLATAVAAGVHEHPGGARAGRRGHRLDRREGPPRRHQAGRRPPGRRPRGRRARASGWARTRRRCHVTGCPSIDLAAEILESPALDFDPFAKYGGVGAPLDLSQRLHRRDAAPGHDRVRAGAAARQRDAARGARHRACRRCGSGRTSTPAPTARRAASAPSASTSTPDEHPLLQEHGPDRFPAAALQRRVPRRQLERRHPRVLVPRRARSSTSASRQAGRERGRNVIDVGYDRRAIVERASRAQVAQAVRDRDLLYGDGHAGPRIADLLAEVPLQGREAPELLMRVLGVVTARGGSKGVRARTSDCSAASR